MLLINIFVFQLLTFSAVVDAITSDLPCFPLFFERKYFVNFSMKQNANLSDKVRENFCVGLKWGEENLLTVLKLFCQARSFDKIRTTFLLTFLARFFIVHEKIFNLHKFLALFSLGPGFIFVRKKKNETFSSSFNLLSSLKQIYWNT